MEKKARHIHIYGLVQGVGFRPFIYRHANQFGLAGWVRNHMAGVDIHVEGTEDNCLGFMNTLRDHAPAASAIVSVKSSDVKTQNLQHFEILKSENGHYNITDVSPDIAVCQDCLQDMQQQDRRSAYPFTNCTHCGPRFSIIREIPYDRCNSSMNRFSMCQDCRHEYNDVLDRRFHAQPISCKFCGPEYTWFENDKRTNGWNNIFPELISAIEQGKIICLKSTGGFQLVCDASNDESINRLRHIKQRKTRPFAVMFCDIKSIRPYAYITDKEEKILNSWRRPIVLLKEKNAINPTINQGFDTLGVVLPYTPLHFMMLQKLKTPAIVFTSANLNSQPLISDNRNAVEFYQKGGCDALLYHNREIVNSADDSVVNIHKNGINIIRRSRGYVPEPIYLSRKVEGILALGADLKNTFCIGKDQRVIISQYMGDLEKFDVFERYLQNIDKLSNLFHFKPAHIIHDLHPDYYSTKLVKKLANQNGYEDCKKLAVQHHHAHIASVMAEHGLDEKIIGVSMDGAGYGDDGKIWGSEFMVCDLNDYQRILHLAYMPLQGGDTAVREPWRLALAMGYEAFRNDFFNLNLDFHNYISKEQQMMIIKAIGADINLAWSSGMGRLFDAVAALLNLVHTSGFEGEGPMKLESTYRPSKNVYPVIIKGNEIQYSSIITDVITDLLNDVSVEEISGRFHNTVAKMISEAIMKISDKNGIKKVALSGGVFQNRILIEKVWNGLSDNGYEVYTNQKVPCNDGGISLGQMAIAAKKMELCV
ncbi:MAG: carbamoyltransferase HypF [Bacteroidales bacterium]|nr:carbamoyltransferase HypF [Bacteroidales bacterium]